MKKSFWGQSASVNCVDGLCYCCSLVYSGRTGPGRLSNITLKSTCIVNIEIGNWKFLQRARVGVLSHLVPPAVLRTIFLSDKEMGISHNVHR